MRNNFYHLRTKKTLDQTILLVHMKNNDYEKETYI